MTKVRPKLLNGTELSGENMAQLALTYIQAINDKAIPNIESAWTYLCKNQCRKAYDNAYKEYEEVMKESLANTWPVAKAVLKQVHDDSKEKAMQVFKNEAIGDNVESVRQELEENIMGQYAYLKSENEKDFEKLLVQSMNVAWSTTIEPKLRSKEYKNFIEFEKDLRRMESQFLEAEP